MPHSDNAPYTFSSNGRSLATLLCVLGVWAVLLVLYIYVEMAWWIGAFLAAFTLPALYDLISARQAGLTLGPEQVRWHAGRTQGEIASAKIKHLRMDTRLDLSVRVTFVLHSGKKVKLPFEATPPHRAFEIELEQRGFTVERHHFGFV